MILPNGSSNADGEVLQSQEVSPPVVAGTHKSNVADLSACVDAQADELRCYDAKRLPKEGLIQDRVRLGEKRRIGRTWGLEHVPCAPSSVLGIVRLAMNSDYHIDTDTIFKRHLFALRQGRLAGRKSTGTKRTALARRR